MADAKPITKIILFMFITNWIFGIGIIEYPLGKTHPTISFIYSSILLIIYCTIGAITYSNIMTFSDPSRITMPIMILYFSHIFLSISTICLGWYRNKAVKNCIAKSTMTVSLMEHIGITINYAKIFKDAIKKIICGLIFILIIISTNAMLVLVDNLPVGTRICLIILMSYPITTMFIADITFVNIISCERYKFIELNKLLKRMLSSTVNFPQHRRIIPPTNRIYNSSIYTNNNLPMNHTIIISMAKQIHLQLIEICQEADNAFALQILLSIIIAFAVITGNLYILYTEIINKNIPRPDVFDTVIVVIIWNTFYTVKISVFSSTCSNCIEQAVKTGDIINELYDDLTINKETQSKIREFNVQLIQTPLKFTAYGFIPLDLTLIQGMISTITTYLMILIQLRNISTTTSDNNSAFKMFRNTTLHIRK